jgi:hypothetical protein
MIKNIKGRIYAVRSPNTDKIYIGSTIMPLSKRMYQHRHLNNLCTSKQIIEAGSAYIELIENYECNDKNELHKREGELIREHKNICVNKFIPCRTKIEYRNENKEKLSASEKIYRNKNKEKLSQWHKEYYSKNEKNRKEYKKQYDKKKSEYFKLQYRAKKIQKIMNVNLIPQLKQLHDFNLFFNQISAIKI